jgi:Family of unknown function (DUF6090)
MINFFRKTRKQMADDNKPLKYLKYAIGEIVLVVIGILIALSINNWNEERKDRIKEKEILGGLKQNLERNYNLLEINISQIDQWNSSTEIIRNVLKQKVPYTDTLVFHFTQVGRNGAFQIMLNYDGYKSYENAGFDIIQSNILENKILSLFEVTYLKIKNQKDYLASWGNIMDMFYSNFYVLEEGMVPINYNELLSSKEYLTFVNVQSYQRNLSKIVFKESLAETQYVLQLINEELAR